MIFWVGAVGFRFKYTICSSIFKGLLGRCEGSLLGFLSENFRAFFALSHMDFSLECKDCLIVIGEQTLFMSYEMALHSVIGEKCLVVLHICN